MENKTGKYLKYALGEILLVVIGILIALQINNWNEERKAKSEEQVLLIQLKSDFSDNLDQLNQKIETRKLMLKASDELFKLIDNPAVAIKDSLDILIARTMPYATFDPIINDLSSSGELKLINNLKLKRALTNWSADIMDVTEDEQSWKEYRHDHYFPFLQSNYQLRTIRNRAFKANVLGSYSIENDTENNRYTDYEIGNSKHQEDYIALLKNPDFEDHLTRLYAINSWVNVQSNILKRHIEDIIEMMDQELQI